MEIEVDMVNHPPHYGQHPSGVECIVITEHMNFCIGNAVKYLWRADLKNGLEDLEKAEWYIRREIDRRKRELYPQQNSESVLPDSPSLRGLRYNSKQIMVDCTDKDCSVAWAYPNGHKHVQGS